MKEDPALGKNEKPVKPDWKSSLFQSLGIVKKDSDGPTKKKLKQTSKRINTDKKV